MRTDGINDSNWKELYRKAMLETDQAKASQHIHEARNAILGRVEQLLVDPVSGEHKAVEGRVAVPTDSAERNFHPPEISISWPGLLLFQWTGNTTGDASRW